MTINRLNSSHFFSVLMICLVLTLSACASADKYKRTDQIDITLNDFRKAIRWGYYEEAARYIQIKDYSKPLRSPEYLKNIRITSYEYGEKFFSEDNTKLEVNALISFYDVNRGTVKKITDKQTWWFDAEKNHWFLDGDIPDMTSAFQ